MFLVALTTRAFLSRSWLKLQFTIHQFRNFDHRLFTCIVRKDFWDRLPRLTKWRLYEMSAN